MIIGNGNIANAILYLDRDDVTFFASGVSDSNEIRQREFDRERELLKAQDKSKHIVYFSSLSIYRSKNLYNQHKKAMEELVRSEFDFYTIVRVEIIAWGKNPTTIHNVFREKLAHGVPIEIQDTFRYVVTLDEFTYWIALIPWQQKSEMNIPGTRYDILEILKMVKRGEL